MRVADEAYLLGGPTARRRATSRSSKLLDVVARSGADAVHPGYGFLAENAALRPGRHRRRRRLGRAAARSRSRSWATRSAAVRPPHEPGSPRCPAPTSPCRARTRSSTSGTRTAGRWPSRRPSAAVAGGCGWSRAPAEAADALESAQREAEKRLRPARVLPREVPDLAPPRRGTGLRRQPRQRRPPGHPGLLGAAPPPEADRGGAGAGPRPPRSSRPWATPPSGWPGPAAT